MSAPTAIHNLFLVVSFMILAQHHFKKIIIIKEYIKQKENRRPKRNRPITLFIKNLKKRVRRVDP